MLASEEFITTVNDLAKRMTLLCRVETLISIILFMFRK